MSLLPKTGAETVPKLTFSARNSASPSERLSAINGLRGLAILAVIFHHCPIHAWVQTKWEVAALTGAGVNLFFILSGFVLYRPYLLKGESLGGKQLMPFLKKRFLRLYPLFFLNCLVCWLFNPAPVQELFLPVLETLSTAALFKGDLFPVFNWVLWSLMLEIWFSVLFPVLLWAIRAFSIRNTTIAVLALAYLARCYQYDFMPFIGHGLIILSRLDDFMAGILICHLYYTAAFVKKENFWWIMGCSLIGLAGVLLTYPSPVPLIKNLTNNFFQLHFCALLLAGLVSVSWFNKILSFKPLQLAGMMCFSLYVWHGVLILKIIRPEFHAVDYAYYALAVFAIASFTYRFVEYRHEESWKKLFLLK